MQTTNIPRRKLVLILVNAAILIITAIIAGIGIFAGAGEGQVGDGIVGWGYFKPFTMDSNILTAISSLILIICELKTIKTKGGAVPKWTVLLHLMGTVSLMLTFAISAAFLAPMFAMQGSGYMSMFTGDVFYFHLLNPVLAFVSFALLLKDYRFKSAEFLWGAVPTLVYAIVYITMVVVLKRWSDFYNFTLGGHFGLTPVVTALILAVSSLFSLLAVKVHNRNTK